MVVFPNAKINLGLNITSHRPDGYHNIVTAMIPVKWCDILEIVPACGTETTLTVTGRHVACDPHKNLVMKAYNAICNITKLPPVDIFLRKIIPDGAGLGGGSSDAAFTLKLLNNLFELNLSLSQLEDIASTIGADCPFFIRNTPMLATGIGTTLSPIEIPHMKGLHIVIVKPNVYVSTAEAYAGVTPHIPSNSLNNILGLPITQWKNILVNDFEQSICEKQPLISQIKHDLYSLGAMYAAMSGSGSAVFGIFSSDKMAEEARLHFKSTDTHQSQLC